MTLQLEPNVTKSPTLDKSNTFLLWRSR